MPEEINRVLTDHTSDLLFAPTETAVKNLDAEGIRGKKVQWVGDVMYDAALCYGETAETRSRILDRLQFQPKSYVLATVHRAENTDDVSRLRAIFAALELVATSLPVVVPVHPRTRNILQKENLLTSMKRVCLIDPVGYLDMVMLEKNARLIATDSGGVQKRRSSTRFLVSPCEARPSGSSWWNSAGTAWPTLATRRRSYPHCARQSTLPRAAVPNRMVTAEVRSELRRCCGRRSKFESANA